MEQDMADTVISITEVTVVSGKTSKINLLLNDQKVSITVPVELKVHFDEQFSRPNPTPLQKKKYATIMNLLKAAYLQGSKDGGR
jgi:hypothetical protein